MRGKMKEFNRIAVVLKEKRRASGLTQYQLSRLLGYKNGQFISNAERGLCSIPAKEIKALCQHLNCGVDEICGAMIEDYKNYVYSVSR